MIRLLAVAALALLSLQAACSPTSQNEQQTLVDRAALTVQEMMSLSASQDPRTMLLRAKAVMICPRLFKAGFFFGGEGGRCVLLARAGNGTWSYPAFYTIGSGSFGFQAGIEDSQLIMMILTEHGLNAVLDNQFKVGGNASVAIATVGGSIQGATTAAVGADIVAFAETRGLFAGIALEGSLMSTQTAWNQAYYNQGFAARQLVIQMQGSNPGADPLRDLLTRFGASAAPGAMPASAAPGQSPQGQAPQGQAPQGQAPTPLPPPSGYVSPPAGYVSPPSNAGGPSPGVHGPVQEQTLPPANR